MENGGFGVSCTFVFREGVANCNTGAADDGVNTVLFNFNAFAGSVVYGVQATELKFNLRFCVESCGRTLQSSTGFNGSSSSPVVIGTGAQTVGVIQIKVCFYAMTFDNDIDKLSRISDPTAINAEIVVLVVCRTVL